MTGTQMTKKQLQDYHTHTFRCKHAQGDVEDYACFAAQHGFEVLGVSDHIPFPDGWCPEVRMELAELPAYVQAIERAQQKFPQLVILKGLECEYEDRYLSYYREELLKRWNFDYLILGQHLFYCDGELVYHWKGMRGYKELKAYTQEVIKGIESGLFAFVAHPDVFGGFYELWDQEAIACSRYILEAAEAYHIPLEINSSGFHKDKIQTRLELRNRFPLEHFWELAAHYDIQVVINSDAHQPDKLGEGWQEGVALARRYNLQMADLSYLCHKS